MVRTGRAQGKWPKHEGKDAVRGPSPHRRTRFEDRPAPAAPEVRFLGGVQEVTGSCFHVSAPEGNFLVECGMFQGGREAKRKNLEAFPFDPWALQAVILSHAHLDHSGLLPRLVALGARAPVHVTEATADLLEVMLLDSAYIQEKEWEWLSKQSHRTRRRLLLTDAPLYTVVQAKESLRWLRRHDYGRWFPVMQGVRARFHDAGHILGSAIVELELERVDGVRRRWVFSGDLGMPGRPLVRDPTLIPDADVVWVESTYGDREHRPWDDSVAELETVLRETLPRGNVVIPSFAVGRTQEMILVLADLVRRGRLGSLNVVVDSPMATEASKISARHLDLWDEPSRELFAWMQRYRDRFHVRFTASVEESMALNNVRSGLVIISASGMCEAGRIKYHLKYNLPRPECAIVIAGFQAMGTLGRRLVDGAQQVTIFGERIPVRAGLHTIGSMSAHADRLGLLAWLRGFRRPPQQCFVTHGEVNQSQAFAQTVRDTLGWTHVEVAVRGQRWQDS
nr:MBL fold metallo-hydrolase [Tepidiphilus olei]